MAALDRVFRSRRPSQERPAAAIIDGLWRNGERGVRFEASDLSTMFQDAAGATPAYMPGQGQVDPPVGLWLDKRKGLVRGPERLTNGDFSGGGAGWGVSGADATHIVTFKNGVMRYQSDTTSPQLSVAQGSILTVGAWYEVVVTVSAWVAGALKSDSLSGVGAAPIVGSAVGTFRFIGRAIVSTFSLTRNAANTDLTIDSISIRELPGNHAYQTTTTSRPTLSARYNLLTYSERFDNAVWTKSNATVPGDFVMAPNGTLTAQKLVETATDNFHYVRAQAGTVGVQETLSIYAKAAGRSWLRIEFGTGLVAWFNLGAGTVGSITGSSNSSKITAVGGGWYQCSVTGVRSTNTNNTFIAVLSDSSGSYAGDGVSGVYIWGADLRPANDGVGLPLYQRVIDANTYDTAGFPLYLKFDGVDDWLQTESVDFSGTDKLFASAALRKLSDAAAGIVVELSLVSNSTPGTFALLAPAGTAPTMGVYLRGAATVVTNTPSGIASPASRVLTGVFDLAAAITQQARSRINGQPAGVSTSSDAGGGVFGSYPLYVGKRGLNASTMFNGRLYGLLIRGAATPDTTIAKVERYLNQQAKVF